MNAPDASSVSGLAKELAAALEWWREAGVDNDFHDDVTAWLDEPRVNAAGSPSAPAHSDQTRPVPSEREGRNPPPAVAHERMDFFADGRPDTLEAFREFWMTAPGLDMIGPRGRVAPRGAQGAELMVLVVDPEQTDTDRLLSGPQGRLLERIIAAMGLSEDQVYRASALPRHTPMADTAALAAGGLDAVLDHHIALAAPKRLVAFGAGLAPMMMPDVTNADTSLRIINHNQTKPPMLMSEGLDTLMDMPRLKARFWKRWIEWSAMH